MYIPESGHDDIKKRFRNLSVFVGYISIQPGKYIIVIDIFQSTFIVKCDVDLVVILNITILQYMETRRGCNAMTSLELPLRLQM